MFASKKIEDHHKKKYMVFDYETRSEADLKKKGAWEYSVDKSTTVLCVGWAIGTIPEFKNKLYEKKLWAPHSFGVEGLNSTSKEEFYNDLTRSDITLVAHNAFFEQVITKNVLPKYFNEHKGDVLRALTPENYICTASMAAAHALPRNLEGVCDVLDLDIKKNMDGNRIMLKWCKPRKPTKYDDSKWHTNPDEFEKICEYALDDVDAEIGVFTSLPMLSPKEKKVWQLDQKINMTGVNVDRDLCIKTLHLINVESKNLDSQVYELTGGEVNTAKQRDALLKYLHKCGHKIENLQAKTIEDHLKSYECEELLPDFDYMEVTKEQFTNGLKLLEIRQSASKSSTAKFIAYLNKSASDGVLRDVLLYHGASTGRWSGRGVQLQNLPRPTLKLHEIEVVIKLIKSMKYSSEAESILSAIRTTLGVSPMDAFSSILRGVIKAPNRSSLICADYNAIEVRVLFWLAGNEHGLNLYRNNAPVYEDMASYIYRLPIEEIGDDSLERFVGKQVVLGAGYQAGADKFLKMCEQFGITITPQMAKNAINTYRRVHKPVVKMWSNMEKAAIRAVQKPGKGVKINKVTWFVKNNFLYCQLPSGRRIAYYKPFLKSVTTPWGEKKPKLYYWGQCSMTKKWKIQSTYGGKLTENVSQAVARDVMADAMIRAEKANYIVGLSVHDELITLPGNYGCSVHHLEKLMEDAAPWCEGLPLKVKGFEAKRYRK